MQYPKPSAVLILFALSAMGAVGCAKDRTLDEYEEQQRRDRATQNYARYQQAEGIYVGSVISRADGANLGTMKLTLRARTQPQAGKDGMATEFQPVLAGAVEFQPQDRPRVTVLAPDGYFDTETRRYQATITMANASDVALYLGGTINDGKLQGSIESYKHGDFGGDFTLARVPDNSQAGALLGRNDQVPTQSLARVFTGTTTLNSGTVLPVQVAIIDKRRSPEEEFAGLFVPVKGVQITVNYGDNCVRLMHTGSWDRRSGQLRVTGDEAEQATIAGARLALECLSPDNGQTLECEHATNIVGLSAHLSLRAGGSVATTTSPRVAQPLPNTRSDETRVFKGVAFMSLEDLRSNKSSFVASLNVTRPARSCEQDIIEQLNPQSEKSVQATLGFFDDTSVTVRFDKARWDREAATLTGAAQPQVDGKQVEVTLRCDSFGFSDRASPFTCEYVSNLGKHVFLTGMTFQKP